MINTEFNVILCIGGWREMRTVEGKEEPSEELLVVIDLTPPRQAGPL